MSDVNRRDALRLLATASVSSLATGLPWTWEQAVAAQRRAQEAIAAAAQSGAGFEAEFFSPHEYETVRVLVDLIIPADERSGGATDVGVPEFMDFMMIDRPPMQRWMRGGLAWLDLEAQRRFDLRFVDCQDAQRTAILDDIAWPRRARPEMSHGVAFLNRFRDLTASGFWTTKAGIEDLEYFGNEYVNTWRGCPEEALKKVGVWEEP